MNDEVFEKLKQFTLKESYVTNISLRRDTRLETDLGISGADGVDFIVAYGHFFNVDVSNFKAEDYFEAEGSQFLSKISELFIGKKETHKNLKELTLADLETGILIGKLDAETLCK